MKALIGITSIMIILIVGWIFIYNSIDNHTNEFITLLNEASNNIKEDNWEEAQKSFTYIQNKWNKVRVSWTILLDHHEIDNIDLSMAKVNEYVILKEAPLSLGEINVLRKLFNIVQENEALTLTNIL